MLTDAYRSVGPDGRLAVLVGEAGIGKSRLAEEHLATLAAAGGTTLTVRCFREERDLAYGAVVELLRTAVAAEAPLAENDRWLGEAARLLPELGPAPARPVDSTAAQVRFYEAVCGLSSVRSAARRPEPCSWTTPTGPTRPRSASSSISRTGFAGGR